MSLWRVYLICSAGKVYCGEKISPVSLKFCQVDYRAKRKEKEKIEAMRKRKDKEIEKDIVIIRSSFSQ